MIKLLTTLKAHLQIPTCKEGNAPYFDSGVPGFYLLSRIRLQGWSCFVSTLSLSPWPEFVFQRDKRSCFPLPGSCLSYELWKSATIITFLLRCYPISSLSRRFGPAWPPLSLPRLLQRTLSWWPCPLFKLWPTRISSIRTRLCRPSGIVTTVWEPTWVTS